MTVTDTPLPAAPVVDSVAASGGPLNVLPPIPDPTDTVVSPLLVMRENPLLSLTGENFFRWRCCGGPLARGWVDPCSPTYLGRVSNNDRYDPNVNRPAGGVIDHDHKCSSSCLARQTFVPFTTYNLQDIDCLTPTFDLTAESRFQVDRNSAWWVTRELDSAPLTGNPSLRSFGWDLTPASGPVSPAQALTLLMRAYSLQGMGGLVVHVPWFALPALETNQLIVTRGGLIRTAGGVGVLAGTGYTGVLPNLDATGAAKPAPVDETLPAQGTIAFYATRSVPEYRLGPIEDYPITDLERDNRTNHMNSESYRRAALRFDPGCVYAVAVNLDQGVC